MIFADINSTAELFFKLILWERWLKVFNFVIFLAGQFTEDGSFIGQYVPGKLQPPVSPQPIPHNPPPTQGGNVATYV